MYSFGGPSCREEVRELQDFTLVSVDWGAFGGHHEWKEEE